MSYIHGLCVGPQWYIHPNRNKTMYVPVIDTLRYANRLKDAGVDPGQAEAMARAFNDELVHGVATKDDVNQAVVGLTHEIGRVEGKIDKLAVELKGEISRLDERMDGFNTQFRYLFLVLTLIAGLGLYNAIGPRLGDATAAPESQAETTEQAPTESVASS